MNKIHENNKEQSKEELSKNKRDMEKDSTQSFEDALAHRGNNKRQEKPMKWNGYYIEASPEVYDLLVGAGYKANTEYPNQRFNPNSLTIQDGIIGQTEAFVFSELKQFYLIDGELTEGGEEDERLTSDMDNNTSIDDGIHANTGNADTRETINITSEDTFMEVCEFVNIEAQDIFNSSLFGGDSVLLPDAKYTVTVKEIKKPWYEDKNNFPALMTTEWK